MHWLKTGERLPDPSLDEQYAVIVEQYEAMLDALRHARSASIARASISAGTRRGCTARPSSATPSTRRRTRSARQAMLRDFYAPWLSGPPPERPSARRCATGRAHSLCSLCHIVVLGPQCERRSRDPCRVPAAALAAAPARAAAAQRLGPADRDRRSLALLVVDGGGRAICVIVGRRRPGALLTPPHGRGAAGRQSRAGDGADGAGRAAARDAPRRRSRRLGGKGRLHVRLVALFSVIASVPTLLVVIFASLLFQSGIEFWFSDRARTVLEKRRAASPQIYERRASSGSARDDVDDGRRRRRPVSTATASTSRGFGDEFCSARSLQRNLTEAAIFTVGDRTARSRRWSLVNLDDRPLEQALSAAGAASAARRRGAAS